MTARRWQNAGVTRRGSRGSRGRGVLAVALACGALGALALTGCSSGSDAPDLRAAPTRQTPDTTVAGATTLPTAATPPTTPKLPVGTDMADMADAASVPDLDPCALVPADEAVDLLGPLAAAPVPQSREGRRVACTYTPSAGPALSLTLDPLSFFDRAATILADTADIHDDSIVVDGDTYVAVWFRTPAVVVGVNGPPGSLGEALSLAERAERNLPV